MSADMMGMYGLGGGVSDDPTNMQKLMLAHMLTNQQQQPGVGSTPAGAVSGAGNQLMAYMLMNPGAAKKLKDSMGGIGTGIGNLASGNDWAGYGMSSGLPSSGALDGLSSQAAGFNAGTAPL